MAARVAALGRTDASKIAALRAALAADRELADIELAVWLRSSDGDVGRAEARWREAQECLAESPPSIRDVAPFLRAPSPERRLPDGCSFLLEDMKGGVARDRLGRPIVAVIGMFHGSAEEMQRQMAYAMSRSAAYCLPGLPPNAECAVIDVVPREKGAPATFRFPDKDIRSLFDLQSRVYPGALCTTTHFCGLPRFVTWSFKLVRPFMARDVYDAMVLSPSFSALPKAIAPENLLERWGGSLQFDIDAYVEWRAREEGVEVCGRGCGRAFDAKAARAAAEEAMDESTAGALTAAEVAAEPAARKLGPAEKRGSGTGLFSTVRWKPKLLAVHRVGLVYFDGLEVDEANTASRIVPLDAAAVAERRERVGGYSRLTSGRARVGPPAQFALVTEAREYLFGVETDAEADAWVAALRAQIDENRAAVEDAEEASRGVAAMALA